MFEMNADTRSAALAGTRMLILEECFDSLVDALITSGAIPQNAASVMLEHLAQRFIAHSSGQTETLWAIDADELLHQAVRLRMQLLRRSDGAAAR